jgi:hypothetical protein
MGKISSITDLKEAIQILEAEQDAKGQLVKDQFCLLYESLRPINLLKSTINEVSSSPYLIDNILGTAAGLTTGYLSKMIVVGASGNIFKKLFGTLLQFGITNVVARHSESIKPISQYLFKRIFHKKEETSETP